MGSAWGGNGRLPSHRRALCGLSPRVVRANESIPASRRPPGGRLGPVLDSELAVDSGSPPGFGGRDWARTPAGGVCGEPEWATPEPPESPVWALSSALIALSRHLETDLGLLWELAPTPRLCTGRRGRGRSVNFSPSALSTIGKQWLRLSLAKESWWVFGEVAAFWVQMRGAKATFGEWGDGERAWHTRKRLRLSSI